MTSDTLTAVALIVLLLILLVCGTLATRPGAPDSERDRYEAAAIAAMEDHGYAAGGALSPGMAALPTQPLATDRATVRAVVTERAALDREGRLLVACDLAIEYQVARDGLGVVALRSKLN